jgi:acyl-CoA thioester hydrolase
VNRTTGYVLTYRGVVYPWHCDHVGHMNVMWYAGKLDEATWNLLALCGITAKYLDHLHRGMAAVQQNTTYKKELFAGDVVSVRTKMLEVRERLIRFQHEMIHDESNEVAALSELTAVHIDQNTRKACAFPSEILERLRKMLDSSPE